jgi:zinc/manganese transport system substrate-binding protein
MIQTIFGMIFLLASVPVFAKLNVMTTTTDAAALVKEVGEDQVVVESFTKGSQDPHYIEAKPSFMLKASKADLLVQIGLGLEDGWIPSVLKGARNPKIGVGAAGSLILGKSVSPLEVPTGPISRDQGDVHPEGNPHFFLDPVRTGELALVVAAKLGELDPAHAKDYQRRAQAFKERIEKKMPDWRKKIDASGIKRVVTHHKTLSYFLSRFEIESAGTLESKPGVPPSAAHIIELTALVRDQKIPLILVENFFEPTAAQRVKKDAPHVRIEIVPVAVGGEAGTDSLEKLYDTLVDKVGG